MGKITFVLDNHPFKVEVKKDDNEVIKIFEFVTGSKITLGERTRKRVRKEQIEITRQRVRLLIGLEYNYSHCCAEILYEIVGKVVPTKDYRNEYARITKLAKEIRAELSETENFVWETVRIQRTIYYKKKEEAT